jgi:copper transport protein
MTHITRFRTAIFLALGLALLISAPALAHAIVTRTDPTDGAVLSEAPRQIRLWFSEEVALNLSKIEVFDSRGQSLPGITAHADATDPALVIVDLPELKPDAYRVAWDALSTDDLHITSGSVVFGVQTAADGAVIAQADTAPQPFEVIVRWADFVALAAIIGALTLALLVRPPDFTDARTAAASERRLLNLALWATGAALITSFGGVLIQAVALSGSMSVVDAVLQLLSQTSYGSRWLMREGWLLVLLMIIVWQRRQPQINRMVLAATMPLLVALAVLQAMNGHATSFDDTTTLVRVVADALHLLGAGAWVGGLIALAVVSVPLLRRSPVEAAQARVMLRRFGLIASASLGVLLVTGLYNAGQQVASIDALLFTSYGRSLLVKIALVLSVGLMGLINSSLLHPRVADMIRRVLRRPIGWTLIPPRLVRRTVVVEMTGAIGIVLLAAVLGSSQPARGPEFDPPTEPTNLETLSSNVKDLFVTFSIKPNRPGQNFISIGAFDTRRPAPAPIERVSVQLTPPDGSTKFTFDADLISKGKYQITGNAIGLPGDWAMTVTVKRPGLADTVWSFPWNVMPTSRLSPRPVVVSAQPLAPWLTLAAAVSALVLAGAGYSLWRLNKTPGRRPSPRSKGDGHSLNIH